MLCGLVPGFILSPCRLLLSAPRCFLYFSARDFLLRFRLSGLILTTGWPNLSVFVTDKPLLLLTGMDALDYEKQGIVLSELLAMLYKSLLLFRTDSPLQKWVKTSLSRGLILDARDMTLAGIMQFFFDLMIETLFVSTTGLLVVLPGDRCWAKKPGRLPLVWLSKDSSLNDCTGFTLSKGSEFFSRR